MQGDIMFQSRVTSESVKLMHTHTSKHENRCICEFLSNYFFVRLLHHNILPVCMAWARWDISALSKRIPVHVIPANGFTLTVAMIYSLSRWNVGLEFATRAFSWRGNLGNFRIFKTKIRIFIQPLLASFWLRNIKGVLNIKGRGLNVALVLGCSLWKFCSGYGYKYS